MKFTNRIKTNWHDTDAYRNVRAGKIIEYMQETANRQCESSGLPLEWLRDEWGLAFILGAISLNIYAPLHAYEEIEVRTWCKEAKSFIFNRYFEIYRGSEKIAEAATTWVLIDLSTKRMVRASSYDFMGDKFFYDEPIDPAILPPKARIDKSIPLREVGKRRITYSDIDYNMHMNNTRYPDMICDFLDEMTSRPCRITSLSLSYLKESPLGATLSGSRTDPDGDGALLVQTVNEAGEVCLEAMVSLSPED